MWVWIDGRIWPEAEATLPYGERGGLFGDGVFETLRVHQGRPHRLQEHLQRLLEGARRLRFARLPAAEELSGAVQELIAHWQAAGPEREKDAYLRINLTRGLGGIQTPLSECGYLLHLQLRPLPLLPDPSTPLQPVAATISRHIRYSGDVRNELKTMNYLLGVLAKEEAREEGCQEALLCNERGELVEGASSNLFLVRDGQLHTPPADGILPGVTRAEVLAICGHLNIPVQERPLTEQDVAEAEAAFLTNSLSGIQPLFRIADVSLEPAHPLVERLWQEWRLQLGQATPPLPVAPGPQSAPGR